MATSSLFYKMRRPLFPNRNLIIRLIATSATFAAVGSVLLFSPSDLEYPAPFRILKLAEVWDALLLAALFYAGIGLFIKRRTSWIVAVCVLASSAIWESVQSHKIVSWLSIFILLTLIIVLATYEHYPNRSEPSAIWRAVRRALLFTAFTTILGCIAGYVLSLIEHRAFNLVPNIIFSLNHMYVLTHVGDPLRHPTAGKEIGRIILFLFGITNYLLVAFALLKPMVNRFTLTQTAHKQVQTLLKKFGTSSEDYFKFFPDDKSYFFAPNSEAFIAYGVSNGVCIALADPIARNNHDRTTILQDFLEFANDHGWQVCFLPVNNAQLPLYEQFGLSMIKLGSNAIVETADFTAKTATNKHFRYINNRFTKLGYTAELLKPPYPPQLLRELGVISNQWLAHDGRKERAFAMGFFDTTYLQSCQLFVVYDKDHQPKAFVNLVPSYSKTRMSFDLLRYANNAPADTSAFLFLHLIVHLDTINCPEFDMGLAPLSGLSVSDSLDEKGLHLLYTYANRYFAFKGLHRFKARFKPTWEPRYAVYQGSKLRIIGMSVELNRLMKYTRDKRKPKL